MFTTLDCDSVEIFGLGKASAPYWLIANVIGLIYGAGILITANENRDLEKEDNIEEKSVIDGICIIR